MVYNVSQKRCLLSWLFWPCWLLSFTTIGTIISNQCLAQEPDRYFLLDIDDKGPAIVALVKQHRAVSWWVEADRELFVAANQKFGMDMSRHFNLKNVDFGNADSKFSIVLGMTKPQLEAKGLKVILYGGRGGLVLMDAKKPPPIDDHAKILEHYKNVVIAAQVENHPVLSPRPKQISPLIAEVLKKIEMDSWSRDVHELSALNRYAKGPNKEQTIAWLVAAFHKIEGVSIETQTFAMGADIGTNVIAKYSTSQKDAPTFIVGGHYDSISEKRMEKAPGAEDNASGVAAMLTIARLLAPLQLNANFHFVGFGGEELGLLGSVAFVKSLMANGESTRVKGVLILDMVGYSEDDEYDILIETSEINQWFIDHLRGMSDEFTSIKLSSTFNYWGSDHVPFLDNSIPAVLLIQNDYGVYPHYHRSTDTYENLVPPQVREVIKLNTAMLIQWADGQSW